MYVLNGHMSSTLGSTDDDIAFLKERFRDARNIGNGAIASGHSLAKEARALLVYVNGEGPTKLDEAKNSTFFGFAIVRDVTSKLDRLFAPFRALGNDKLTRLSAIGQGSGQPKDPTIPPNPEAPPGGSGGGGGGSDDTMMYVGLAVAVGAAILLASRD